MSNDTERVTNRFFVPNPIPTPKVPLHLSTVDSTKITVDSLKEELTAIGLTCEKSDPSLLQGYINSVMEGVLPSDMKSFHYATFTHLDPAKYGEIDTSTLMMSDVSEDLDINGNFEPTDSPPGMNALKTVVAPEHFDDLLANAPAALQFAGIKTGPKSLSGEDDSVTALESLFRQQIASINGTLVVGIDRFAIEAFFDKIIKASTTPTSPNYDFKDNRTIFLALNYKDGYCDAYGALNVQWLIHIDNYKRKRKHGGDYHKYSLTVTVRAAIYTDLPELTLAAQVAWLLTRRKDKLFFNGVIPVPNVTRIFDSLPPANNDTFIQGILLEAPDNDHIASLILFTANLQNVGCIENTGSDCETSYSKTITTGFTFSMGEKIAVGTEIEAGCVFAKAKVSINLELSFNEEWNSSQSETISFTVPAGKKSYLYQAVLGACVLTYDVNNIVYQYQGLNKVLTNTLITSNEPILEAKAAIISEKSETLLKSRGGKLPLWRRISE